MLIKEELGGIDIEDNGNLEDLLRIVLIHEECGNLKVRSPVAKWVTFSLSFSPN